MSNAGLVQRIQNPPQPPAHALVPSKVLGCCFAIAHIVIGSVYLEDCPRQRYIPVYLIVGGVFSLVWMLLSFLPCIRKNENTETENSQLGQIYMDWNLFACLFLFCWFIAGNVWIYSIYQPNYDKNTMNADYYYVDYCHQTLYLFAFWTTTLVYILLGLFLIFGLCSLLGSFLCRRADPDVSV